MEQYVCPGTLINTKIIKVVENGVFVKFLKIFIGYIHADQLLKNIDSYSVDEKILAIVIFYCVNPPTIYLSEKHRNLSKYEPKRDLFAAVKKPELIEMQGSFFNKKQ